MKGELVFSVRPGLAIPARPISLAEAGLRERSDLQEWIRNNPAILGPDVRIVTFEFADWRSRAGTELDRLDLLGIDTDGRLVIAELKRGMAPDTVEMQAIKYAAYASRFTPETLAASHAAYLTRVGGSPVSTDEALALLVKHAGGELEITTLRRPRIALVAAGFPPQVSAAAVWLSEMGIEVSLVEFAAYRTEHDTVLTVSQIWPVREIEEFTVSPRQAEVRAAEERTVRVREVRSVTRLIEEGTLVDGTGFMLSLSALPVGVRDAVARWITEDTRRGLATWRNDGREPLVWAADGRGATPTGLAIEIIEQATGERVKALQGPRVWVSTEGVSLAELAGAAGSALRDWSRLHAALAAVHTGEWTTYGDLAEIADSHAVPVGQHVAGCVECPNAYRVLTADGRVATEFRWDDPADTRNPRAVLEDEGVTFVGAAADARARVGANTLRERIGG